MHLLNQFSSHLVFVTPRKSKVFTLWKSLLNEEEETPAWSLPLHSCQLRSLLPTREYGVYIHGSSYMVGIFLSAPFSTSSSSPNLSGNVSAFKVLSSFLLCFFQNRMTLKQLRHRVDIFSSGRIDGFFLTNNMCLLLSRT